MDQFREKIDRFTKKFPNGVLRGLLRAAEMVRAEAVVSHLSGPKMSKGVGSDKHATLARQTGDLAGATIAHTKKQGSKLRGIVTNNMKYAWYHTKGIGVPKRPFLEPSLEAKRRRIPEIILEEMMREYK